MSDTSDQQGGGHVDPTAPPAPDPLAAPPSPYPATEPIPQSPTDQPTYGQPSFGQDPYGQSPAYPPPAPSPYGQPTGYGHPSPYAQPTGYGQPSPYAQPTGYGHPSPYAQPYPGTYVQPANNGSALALTIVSAVSVAFCGGLLVIPALVMGIMGLSKQSTDPERSRRMSRNGWWAYGIGIAVSVIVLVALFAVIISSDGSGSISYDGY